MLITDFYFLQMINLKQEQKYIFIKINVEKNKRQVLVQWVNFPKTQINVSIKNLSIYSIYVFLKKVNK